MSKIHQTQRSVSSHRAGSSSCHIMDWSGIHSDPVKVCIIQSTNCLHPCTQLSKFLASLLSPIVGLTDSHMRNSQQFAQFVTTQKVPDTKVIVCFDVVSPFTFVPNSRAIQVTRDRLMNVSLVPDKTSLSVDTSAPCSTFAWRPPTWPLRARYTSRSTAQWWGHPYW